MAGRGGRGAALLRAIEELKRRPGQSEEDAAASEKPQRTMQVLPPPAVSAPPQTLGRGALLQMYKQTREVGSGDHSKEVSPEGLVRPPSLQERGRGVSASLRHPPSGDHHYIRPPTEEMAKLRVTPMATPISSSAVPTSPLVSSPHSLSSSPPPPIRMHGVDGTKMLLTANYIRLRIEPGKGIFEYAVTYNPQIDSKNMRFILLRDQEAILGRTRTFDGAKLYLPFRLSNPLTILTGKHPIDQSPVTIYIKFICNRNFGECIHLYNVLFKRVMKILHLTQIGRNYFDSQGGIQVPQHKLEVWPGYVTAVEEFEGGLMLQCDVSHRVLRTTTVRDILSDLAVTNPNNLKEMAVKMIVGCIVMTRYNNKTYRVDEISWDESPRSTFTNSAGQTISYLEYYKKAYNIRINDEAQPILLHRAKRIKGKEETRLICLIPELSVLTGLTDEMRADFKIMKDIAAHTRVTPNQRIYAYNRFIENVENNEAARKELLSWGLILDSKTVELEGRLMQSQRIYLKSLNFRTTRECDWTRELTRDGVITAVNLDHWCVVFFVRDGKRATDYVEMMMKVGPQMGIQVARPDMREIRADRNEAFLKAIRECAYPKLQVVVVIVPTMRDDRYSAIKKLCCCEMPIPSQVINSKTISQQQKLRSVTQKIALQINCKLGGELWALDIPLKNLMVCGIDVYHDASRNGRSVAGFVASINASLTRWYSRSCFQEANQELIDGLRLCLIGALKKYHDINHILPSRIVIFRDGVSDGQLNFVAKYEIEQLCKTFSHFNDYSPLLSVVVVQKRINTRLFLRQREDQLENPPPGTIVDHTITRRNWYDFFLVSQHVRQGTVSPTHYIVIHDSNQLRPDDMQCLSYKLTHLYYNWPGTVRVPAPCQYAHKLASLVGMNLHKEASPSLSDRLFFL